jgi:protein-S-isoprenylcysteine O-methyltransferase Ste14
MSLVPRLLLLAALLAIGLALLINVLAQKRRTGTSPLRWPDSRHPGVILTDLLFWLSVVAWIAGSGAWIVWPTSRLHLGPYSATPVDFLQILGAIFLYLGVTCILWGFISLGMAFRTSIDYQERTRLVTAGVYRFSRHPMAAGLMLTGLGTALMHQSGFLTVAAVGLIVANLLRVRNEEKQLRRILGDEYLRYMERVPRFPGLAVRRNS